MSTYFRNPEEPKIWFAEPKSTFLDSGTCMLSTCACLTQINCQVSFYLVLGLRTLDETEKRNSNTSNTNPTQLTLSAHWLLTLVDILLTLEI